MPVKIGELLLKEKRITAEQLQQALAQQKANGGKLGYNLVRMGFVKDEEITALLSKQYGVPSINLAQFTIDPAVVKLVPADSAKKYQLIPLSRSGQTITIAMTDPTNVFAMDDIKFKTGYTVEPVVASETAIIEAIDKYYPSPVVPGAPKKPGPVNMSSTLEAAGRGLEELQASLMGDAGDVQVLDDMAEISPEALFKQGEEAPIVRLVNVVLMSAIQKGASDIHIEPYEKELRVRYRIDGILYNIMSPPLKYRDAISSRLKIMSKLDIAEKRLPQDGRIKIRFSESGGPKEIDFRVSVLPTLFGEKIVMRLLDKDKLRLDLTKLGFEPESLVKFEAAIQRPWGMVLVTGPTGSGKTNTLYSSIAKINTPETNIMTAEDPVEFNLSGINQVQVREAIGLSFAAALRSFLRQDPNIILVGEIRDFETAEIAVKAALTGHLVLSTLHTNDAPSTVNRLMNMGIEPFLVASSVHMICAQRLVRKICGNCAEEHAMPPAALVQAGFTADEAATVKPMKGAGCDQCNSTGYRGRVGLYEVMEIGEEVRELILVGASGLELRRKAIDEGMITLRRSGLRKVQDGVTTIEEVVRETVNNMATLPDLLKTTLELEGSDLHIASGTPPQVRVHGSLRRLEMAELTPSDTKQLVYSVLTDAQKKRFEETLELDFSFGIRGLARFRCNVFTQRGAVGAVFRLIPEKIRSFGELGLPPVLAKLAEKPRGLVLVTGPTGSGKSTTLAAMIDKINVERRAHILTIEDPIEYIHPHKGCLVNQRELLSDTLTFSNALRGALREDPDVVLIGEMRDLDTVESTLKIAETGHLTFATLHTNSAAQTINRVIDIFPTGQQSQIKTQLSLVLEGIVSQQLLPRADGKGRVLALEIMIPTPAIRNLIRDKVHQIYGAMQTDQEKMGMQTLNQSLASLYMSRMITFETALAASSLKEELIDMINRGVGVVGAGAMPARPAVQGRK